jgi:hypothetical protein
MKSLASLIIQTVAVLSSRLIRQTRLTLHIIACLLVVCAGHSSLAQQGQPREEPAAPPATTRTGKITGRIVADDGKPLSDAAIYIFKMYARLPAPSQNAQTDDEGKFQSGSLSPGLYSISVQLPGFTLSQPDVNESGEQRLYRPGDSVTLTMVKGGVITGVVRDSAGEPVVGVLVRAVRVRDASGKRFVRAGWFARDRMTDDRGVYRIYGIEPGTYIVLAGGGSRSFGVSYAYSGDAPTYFPSSTRDTAADVVVHHGEEVTGIDIRYRQERGRTLSGTISGVSDTSLRQGISIILRQVGNAGFTDQTFIQPTGQPAFAFDGVVDGEYELVAQQGMGSGADQGTSASRRVTVKGTDLTGLELTLAPLASITGRTLLDAAPKDACEEEHSSTLLETVITALRDEKRQERETLSSLFFTSGTVPDGQGDFTIRNLGAGSYRLKLRLPDDAWYARSISLPGAVAAAATATRAPATKPGPTKSAPVAPPSLITLKAGERLTGATIQIARDGATLRGKLISSAEGASLPDNLKVYLIPQERERAEDTLRFSEANVMSDGAFVLKNLAPGRYHIIARPAPENESPDSPLRPLFWDADARARLRREAEALNATIDLKPCQRVSDYELRYPAIK